MISCSKPKAAQQGTEPLAAQAPPKKPEKFSVPAFFFDFMATFRAEKPSLMINSLSVLPQNDHAPDYSLYQLPGQDSIPTQHY